MYKYLLSEIKDSRTPDNEYGLSIMYYLCIRNSNNVIGGITLMFSDDFGQILSDYLWELE